MNIDNKIKEIIKTTAWMNQQTIQKKEAKRQNLKIKVQHILHEISLIRFCSYNSVFHLYSLTDMSLQKIITEFIQREPLRLHSKLSPNISQFIIQWIIDFTTHPKLFAEAVIKTLPNFGEDSEIFIYVTFPSMFYHFQTNESLTLATEFLKEIIQKSPSNYSISFVSVFLLSATKFVYSLWKTFDELIIKKSPIRSHSDYFFIFIEALQMSSTGFTKFHVEIIKYFKEYNLNDFAKCIISNFLNITYDESHLSTVHDDSRQLIQFLKYAERNPTSSHFTKIYNSLIPSNGTLWIPFHSDLIETRIPLVMNCHEFFLIQQIAKENPGISNLKYIQNLSVPATVYNDFNSVYFEVVIPLPQEAKNTKDQLGSLIFGEKFYETEIDTFIVKPPVNTNDSDENQLLSRRWRQVSTYARTKNVHPLSLFMEKTVGDPTLSKFGFDQSSPLFRFGLKEISSEALKIQSQFEIFMNRLLLSNFLQDTLQILSYILIVVLQKFTLNMIKTDRINDEYYLNHIFYSAFDGARRLPNYASVRFAGHFAAPGKNAMQLKEAFYPERMKSCNFMKLMSNRELFDIFFVQINSDLIKQDSSKSQQKAAKTNAVTSKIMPAKKALTVPNSPSKLVLTAPNSPSQFALMDPKQDFKNVQTLSFGKKRRHSGHSIQFIHTSQEFCTGISRVLKSRGRTKSPLEICMISKIIDEWKIDYFNIFGKGEIRMKKQNYGNSEVSEFDISTLQNSFISFIEMWKTKSKMNKNKNNDFFIDIKGVLKYIIVVAKEINKINKMKKGSAIFQLVKIGELIRQISENVLNSDFKLKLSDIQFKIFQMALLMSNSEGLFEAFLLYEKLSADIVGFNSSIPLKVMKSIVIIVNCFWSILKQFDKELYMNCIHFVEHMQYNFSI